MIDHAEVAREAPADKWFVIWTESRAEKKVEQRIAALGLGPWLPVVTERRRWSDRWREVECALFPGYLFARATNAKWNQVLGTPGVLTVVKAGEKPALVADHVVSGLREALARGGSVPESVRERVDYEPGDEVIVQEGALAGVRGIVRERRSRRQLVIWVAEIGRGVAFTIGSAAVREAATRSDAGGQLVERSRPRTADLAVRVGRNVHPRTAG